MTPDYGELKVSLWRWGFNNPSLFGDEISYRPCTDEELGDSDNALFYQIPESKKEEFNAFKSKLQCLDHPDRVEL